MKTVPVIIFASAVAALAVLALQSVAAFAALFSIGLVSTALADYGGSDRRRSAAPPAESVAPAPAPKLRLAA